MELKRKVTGKSQCLTNNKQVKIMDKAMKEMLEAAQTVSGVYSKVYDALLLDYSEDDVLKMMNGGFNQKLEALCNEIFKLGQIEIVDDDEKKV